MNKISRPAFKFNQQMEVKDTYSYLSGIWDELVRVNNVVNKSISTIDKLSKEIDSLKKRVTELEPE